ncbi:segregation and condensation protein A [Hydrotalea sandarakina]|uniref:Segregation and condensation protein A n=1 Tax=Hydrotalea sandarakina TaxID=1004304 RepID=A0A2W7RV85_9BACT|nr:segregation/condensation protein A [Hydrotalea sandarakina]PZX64613.1 condensin subunit ScpA [Hydrotalea sandarakina]
MNQETYQIKLEHFEGPFDLLLFFIERDELDIYNIPISKIINDFLDFIHAQERLNIELSSEFILFVSTLMRIKARLLLPRKEVDAQGNEIDPRQELVDKILEYKRFKEAAAQLAEMEANRQLLAKRGNLQAEMAKITEEAGEGTEIQTITLFKLMKTFERVMQRMQDKQKRPTHTVVRYNYTIEGSRDYMLEFMAKEKSVTFENIFEICENRIHAIFLFLSILELVQQKFMKIMVGEGRNNFILEWNENREDDLKYAGDEVERAGEHDPEPEAEPGQLDNDNPEVLN